MSDAARPVAELGALTIDGVDAEELARFYVHALGATYEGESDGYHFARLPHLAFCFRTVDDFVAPTWGGTGVPMQMHLELYVDDLDRSRRRLESFGASTPDHQPELHTGLIVMLDPSGHPFCIFERPVKI